MQTKNLLPLGVALVLLVLCKNSPLIAQGSLVTDSLYGSSLENNLLGDPVNRHFQVYLPPGYDTSTIDYPVVYLFHTGTAGEQFYPYNEFPPIMASFGMFTPPQDFPESGFVVMIDSLILTGKIEPLIVVMPNVNSAYGGSFCINSLLNGNYEEYIVNDIIPYVDAHYNTLADRNSRAIAGHCMGGYGATYLAMKHPDVFGAVAGHSADLCISSIVRALQPMIAMENPRGITGPDMSKPFISFLYMFSAAFSPNLQKPPYLVDLPVDDTCAIREDILLKWAENDPIQLFSVHKEDLQSLKGIYFDVGNNDELQSSYFMIPFIDSLNASGISNSFEIYEGTHFNKLYSRLRLSLAYLSGVLDHSGDNQTNNPARNHMTNSALLQNYPNPFKSETTIDYSVTVKSPVKIQVFDNLGRTIATLVDDEFQPGSYQVIFNATGLQDGVYYYRLNTGNYTQTRKCMLIK